MLPTRVLNSNEPVIPLACIIKDKRDDRFSSGIRELRSVPSFMEIAVGCFMLDEVC